MLNVTHIYNLAQCPKAKQRELGIVIGFLPAMVDASTADLSRAEHIALLLLSSGTRPFSLPSSALFFFSRLPRRPARHAASAGRLSPFAGAAGLAPTIGKTIRGYFCEQFGQRLHFDAALLGLRCYLGMRTRVFIWLLER